MKGEPHPWMAKEFVTLRNCGYSAMEASIILCGGADKHNKEVERLERFFGIVRYQRKKTRTIEAKS